MQKLHVSKYLTQAKALGLNTMHQASTWRWSMMQKDCIRHRLKGFSVSHWSDDQIRRRSWVLGLFSESWECNAFAKSCFSNENHVMQEMSNDLDLLVFRLKAKELIYTVLYKCRLLEYTLFITPNVSSPSLSPPTFMVLYPQNHVWGNYSNMVKGIVVLILLRALSNWIRAWFFFVMELSFRWAPLRLKWSSHFVLDIIWFYFSMDTSSSMYIKMAMSVLFKFYRHDRLLFSRWSIQYFYSVSFITKAALVRCGRNLVGLAVVALSAKCSYFDAC